MSTHLTETQINDLVDETLDSAELQWALSHAAECPDCRAEVEALRAMLQRVAQLPRAIQPDRDLRPSLGLGDGESVGRWDHGERKTLWHWRYPLAAAAVALIAISSTITVIVLRDTAPDNPMVAGTPIESTTQIDLVRLEQRYSDEVRELEQALAENRDALSPETVRIMETNLQIIDRAIAEAQAALQNDPHSAMLGELLRSAWQRKLDLLKAARTAAAT